MISDELKKNFDAGASMSDDSRVLKLGKPRAEGMGVLLEASFEGKHVDVAKVRAVYAEKSWAEDHSLDWDDVVFVAHSLDLLRAEESEDDVFASGIADLVDAIAEREKEKQFPIIRPMELKQVDDQEAAGMALALVDKVDAVKIQSYIAEQRRLYFVEHPDDEDGVPLAVKVAKWDYTFWYFHLRRFLIQESLASRVFAHRFQEGQFLAVIPPQSLGCPGKRAYAFDGIKRMEPTHLPEFDKALWKKWSPTEEVLKYSNDSETDAFIEFVEDDYFQTMHEVIDKALVGGVGREPPFKPRVPAETGATVEVATARSEWLKKAKRSDGEVAEAAVVGRWQAFRNGCDISQQRRLPMDPPSKYWDESAAIYYGALSTVFMEANMEA